MKIGSLFSGYEGLGLAVKAVFGGDLAWVSDIDPGACKILAHHYPDVPNLGDITTIEWANIEPVDILTGGSPCQDLSHAGKRNGMTAGTRSNLWVSMRDAIEQLHPALVVWENVRGAYSADADSDLEPCPGCVGDGSTDVLRALGRVLGDLTELGYDTAWHGITAASIGAPHNRHRVFLIAWPAPDPYGIHDANICEKSSDRPRSIFRAGDPANTNRAGLEIGASIPSDTRPERAAPGGSDPHPVTLLPTPDAGMCKATIQTIEQRQSRGYGSVLADLPLLLPTPTGSDGTGCPGSSGRDSGDNLRTAVTLLPTPTAVPYGNNQSPSAGAAVRPSLDSLAPLLATPTCSVAKGGAPQDSRGKRDLRLDIARTDWGVFTPAIQQWEALTRVAPTPTETGPKGGQRLSPRFVEWMMGLPVGWVTSVPGISRNDQLKALGNGVVPAQAEAALRYLINAMEMAT